MMIDLRISDVYAGEKKRIVPTYRVYGTGYLNIIRVEYT